MKANKQFKTASQILNEAIKNGRKNFDSLFDFTLNEKRAILFAIIEYHNQFSKKQEEE